MKTFSRRSILSGAAALAGSLMLPRVAHAAEFTFKIASDTPATHPCNVRASEAAARIKEESKGRIEINVFPNNQLGAGPDMLSQVRSGALDFFIYSTQLVAPLVPVCSLPGVGFAFKDTDTALKAMDGDLGTYLRAQIDKTGIMAMPKMWTSGYRQTTSSARPIKTPDDMAGFKIRVPAAPMWVSLFKAFGASPTAINFAELYTALQTKVVDGQENPLIIIETNRLYEVQKFCSLTNHMWDGYWILANKRSWAKLPPDLQAIVSRNFDKSALDERADMAREDKRLRDDLAKKNLQFNDVQVDLFRNKLKAAGYYAEWKEKFGAEGWKLLEQYAGALG